jgi:hypothetical protein
MNVLIACEESQRVCIAFREKGHRAFSCDIQECSGGHPEWHIQGDVIPLLNGNCTFQTADTHTHTQAGKWDLIIAHPPCTYLSNVATRHYSLKCCAAEKVIARWEERARAAVFFMQFALADCDHIAVENPVGFMNSSYRPPDQIIHPYFFAESEDDTENYHEKRTCLWLKGLPQLERSNSLPPPPPMYILQGKKPKKIGWCEGMRNISGGQFERAKARSKTFPGIAKAMADQWGGDADLTFDRINKEKEEEE